MAKKTTVTEESEPTFTKEQLIHSKRYAHKRDLLTALLKDGEALTLSQADEQIETYLKGRV